MQFIELAKLLIGLLPTLVGLIRAVEEAIPGQGQGEAKLAAVRGMLETAWGASNDLRTPFEAAWPVVQTTIGTLVKLFNNAGWK